MEKRVRGPMRQVASALLLSALAMGVTACQSGAGVPAERTPRPPHASAGDGKAVDGGGITAGDGKVVDGAAVSLVGDAVDLGGRTFGEHLRISVRGYVDPAIGIRAAQRPGPGKRRIGVDVALVNVGGKTYDASGGKAWVVDENGRRYPAVRTGEITTGFPLKWNALTVGEQSEGWLVFEVPENARIVRLHSTIGNTSLNWQLQHEPSR
ncbi:DUF4352 domain-containing protein [Streptomyces sp. NPDC020681]|uniref:DUF4352 domain-containing protein n=1 Tax=Streptomyces sp. NPDC020681 TaxID=3365083 RepID=UPI00379D7FED